MRGRAISISTGICAAAAAAALSLLLAVHAGAAPSTRARAAANSAQCVGAKATGPFHIAGTQVLNATGQPFVPYGITAGELSMPNWPQEEQRVQEEIDAAADNWCANTIRIQVAPADLLGRCCGAGGPPNPNYLQAIRNEVTHAVGKGLVVVLSAQTEKFPNGSKAPTEKTERFWKYLAAPVPTGFGGDPQVIFDLFNEPRLVFNDTAANWRVWLHGSGQYVGMQQLADTVRGAGANNLLWVQGPGGATTLDKVAKYKLNAPVVYAFHHPQENGKTVSREYAKKTPIATLKAQWEANFGYLITKHIAPVVDGEFANYTASRGACWPDAPEAIGPYFSFLQSHGIGMTAWALNRGVLIKAPDQWSDPTVIGSDWLCGSRSGEGAGNRIRNWYRAVNR